MRTIKKLPNSFWHDRKGTVLPVFGLLAIVMFILMGGAIDLGRWVQARQMTVKAMDAAVLAGGRMLQITDLDDTQAMLAAQRFYDENVTERPPLKVDTVRFRSADNGTAVVAEGTAILETVFLKLIGIPELSIFKAGAADFSKAQLAVGGNAESNIEVSVMLDVSGSMSGQKLADMKEAAKDLVNIVVWDDQSKYTSKIALAPFSGEVRVPSGLLDKVRGMGPFANIRVGGATYRPTNCLVERTGLEKFNDAAPGIGNFMMTNYSTSGSCAQPTTAEVVPLTSSKPTLLSKIDGLTLGGGTAGHLGTAWAWYTLSPRWAEVFSGESKPAPYSLLTEKGRFGQPKLRKIAILMTDGEYNRQYTAQGIAGTGANGTSVVQALALCDGMKAAGITVYTVGFDLGGNQTAISTLQSCASDPTTFYNTADGSQLRQAFRDIALKISSLFLSQ